MVLLAGLALAVGGVYLATLGGSWYYLVAGIGIVLTGIGLFLGRRWALHLYALVLAGTVIWALYEVGLRGWELEPRMLVPTCLGIYLLFPWVVNRLGSEPSRGRLPLGLAVVFAIVVGGLSLTQSPGINGTLPAQANTPDDHDTSVADSDWQFYGRTPRGDRFSPLAQINTSNISHLKVAWQARTGDTMRPGEDVGGTDAGHEFNFEDTPTKVGNTLYVCTGHSWVVALDAKTGQQKWSFNPKADTDADVYLACRGVAYYEAPKGVATDCPTRIIAPVLDARVMALNAETGKPCEDFGEHGFISLTQYLGHVQKGFHFVTSPPMVLHDRLILGGWVWDNQAEHEPSGAIRAFNPITGALTWAWDVGHEPHNWKPGPNDELTRGTPNAWGVYTADADLGLVYLPLGNATPDYFGGHRRPFDEKYNSSIVALDIATGEERWHFQTTHHDLWDMDLPIGPSLVNVPDPANAGSSIPALVQTNKRGEFFMLDRRNGLPIAKVEEKPVPQGAVAGDYTSPTQPYSTGLPSVTPADLTEKHLWGATPFDQMLCRIEFKSYNYQGQFTPPGLKPTIVYPAFDGVIDWMGASIDPNQKVLVANSNYIPFIIQLIPRDARKQVPAWDGKGDQPANKSAYAPQYGTPYVGSVHPWLNPVGVPCNSPPWGTLTAIDLKSRSIVWQHPVGTTRDTGPLGTHTNLPFNTGIFNIGGNMVTKGGLVFMGATADNYLRAFDERTGEIVWKDRLPAGGQATPMSYSVDGKQFVVIAAGGHGGLGTKSGDYVIAYSLDDNARQ
nr:membrane-bound PQQ-dependent dehydrogenase, glucose/quinate/shikimate family [Pseudomonas sp. dw_358]